MQVCLPKTPSTAPTQAIKPPLELLPANTPLAADVLTGLSLGTLADVAVDVAENGTPKPSVLNVFQHNSLSVQANSGDEDQSASHLSQHRSGEAEGISTAAARPRIVPSKAAAKAAKVAVSALAATGPMSRPQASSKDNERKGCNCKRSMCLKMYCECFAAGKDSLHQCSGVLNFKPSMILDMSVPSASPLFSMYSDYIIDIHVTIILCRWILCSWMCMYQLLQPCSRGRCSAAGQAHCTVQRLKGL